jgi:hypothetical protein
MSLDMPSVIKAGDAAVEVIATLAVQKVRIREGIAELEAADAMKERGWKKIGRACELIRDNQLYREDGFESFDAFMKHEYGYHRGVAGRYIDEYRVSQNVPEVETESHARELRYVPDEVQPAAWAEAKVIAGDNPVQAKHVREAVAKVAPEVHKPKPKPAAERTGEEEIAYRREIGDIPANAEAFVIYPEPQADDVEPDEPECELTDDEWLETLPARESLSPQCRAWFDAESVAFRKADPHRLAFVAAFRPIGNAAKKSAHGHIGPYLSRVYRYFQGNDPTRWLACKDCGGTGQMPLIGNCAACRGNGYHV